MLNKFIYRFFIILMCLLEVNLVTAKENNLITLNDSINAVTDEIDIFFHTYPNENSILWLPVIKGKTRLSFLIPKTGYKTSKRYKDASDLFYLSKINTKNFLIHKNKVRNINLVFSENINQISYKESFMNNIYLGFFAHNKKDHSFGVSASKELIIDNSSLISLNINYPIQGYVEFETGFSKLSLNEKYEVFSSLNFEGMNNQSSIEIGHTWFDLIKSTDLTLSIYNKNSNILPAIYVTNYRKNTKITAGLDKIRNNKSLNLFIKLNINILNNSSKFITNLKFNSPSDLNKFKRLSLREYRVKNAHQIWRDNIQF
jgi:hypothetical protein